MIPSAAAGSFPDDVVAAIATHMNRDHAEDSLLLCQVLGAQPRATAAAVIGVNQTGVEFLAVVDEVEMPVHLAWESPVAERAQVRVALVAMVDEARRRAGLAPRTAVEH